MRSFQLDTLAEPEPRFLGSGLTLKAGKWGTLIGYEVYESPKNLNFSRSFLYTLGTPYTHTGLLATYPFSTWFSATVGFTNGWDNADNNNGYPRPIGSFAFTPNDKLSATVNYLFGPEQNRDQMRGKDINNRWIVDTTISLYGHRSSDPGGQLRLRGRGERPGARCRRTPERQLELGWDCRLLGYD